MTGDVTVRVDDRSYPVRIESGILDRVGDVIAERFGASRIAVLIDSRVASLYGARVRRSFRRGKVRPAVWAEIPPGERSKSLAKAKGLYVTLLDGGVDRWTPVVAIGGGVTGDLAGFVASTLFRGMPLIHVPTTVVAQTDSSVGGKTAVNFASAKNLVGTFHQPELVLCDPAVLDTLTERDYRAGLAEVVKIGVTLRPDLMERLESAVAGVRDRDPAVLAAAVRACVEAKAEVVGRDERDRDVRSILNYGHTLGHALEGALAGRLRHGEAVAMGMNGAAWIGERLGVTPVSVRTRQNELLEALGLKLSAEGTDNSLVARKLKLDKKVRNRKNRFVLTLQIGGASVWPHIPSRLLREAVRVVTR